MRFDSTHSDVCSCTCPLAFCIGRSAVRKGGVHEKNVLFYLFFILFSLTFQCPAAAGETCHGFYESKRDKDNRRNERTTSPACSWPNSLSRFRFFSPLLCFSLARRGGPRVHESHHEAQGVCIQRQAISGHNPVRPTCVVPYEHFPLILRREGTKKAQTTSTMV